MIKTGSEMTHLEFKEFIKSYESLFKNETVPLEKFERDDNVLSLPFCICYKRLLEDRLYFSKTCADYYRAMAEKSFWFMKRLVLRRAMKFEDIHYRTLGRLIQVKTYIRTFDYGSKEKSE